MTSGSSAKAQLAEQHLGILRSLGMRLADPANIVHGGLVEDDLRVPE
jgi:hypothetical protein